jgi:hypothetical protein
VVRTFNAELNWSDAEAPQVSVTYSIISYDASAECCQFKHMQAARAVATVVGLHQKFENCSAALLTPLLAHSVRLVYAGSSVIIAVCCAARSPRKLSRATNRTVDVILRVTSKQWQALSHPLRV